MQTWAKRGLQTALVTGGMLMLGTGIASADEKVDPDTPAGPLDLTVSIPVDIDDNAVGTPLGQVNLPGYHGEISTKPVTDALNKVAAPVSKAAAPAAPVAEPAKQAVSKVTETASTVGSAATKQAAAQRQAEAPSVEPTDDPLMGNKVVGNLAVPIQITGNAIGLLGHAEVDSDHEQSYAHNSDVSTSGAGGGVAGNVVALDWALPVQISGNAGSLLGSAKTSGSASQEAATTGDIDTDGTNGALAGNVVSPQLATPVQVSGNALAWFLGHSETDFDAESEAETGGYIATDGDKGAAAGNVVGAPIALPVRVANDAVTWGGDADAAGSSEVEAHAGDTKPGLHDIPSYIQTSGNDGFLAGNIAQPQGALLASVTGTAAAWIGNAVTGDEAGRASAGTSSEAEMTAGGASNSSGTQAAGSGNVVDLPVALPVEVFGVGGTWIGNAHAKGHENSTSAVAGADTLTNGDGSVLSANTVGGQIASTVEAFGIGGSWIGNASGQATEEKVVDAGGYNGTRGNESAGSGNIVQVPLALPAEVFGVGGSWIGQGIGAAEETKVVKAGGGGNTEDDYGFAAANLVSVPVSLPAQVFGVGGTWIGNGFGTAVTDTTSEAGGKVNANGKKGTGAGNIGFVPVSLPVQVHGIGGSWIGNGGGASDNLTDSVAGGDATATGEGGSIAGNIIQVPAGAAATVFGIGGSWVGTGTGASANDVVSEAGGDSTTIGDGGSIAGNVISAQALPIAQVFGSAASLTAVSNGAGDNTTDVVSGGDIETSGVEGALSGDILDVPVGAVAQVFGVAASVGGVAHAVADNATTGEVGGETTTEGTTDALSGLDGQLPLGALVQVYDIPLGLIAVVSSMTSNETDLSVAGEEPLINLPITGSELPATALPSLPARSDLPVELPTPADLPLPTDALNVSDVPSLGDLPLDAPQVNTLPVELPAQRADLPQVPGLPQVPALPELGSLTPQADLPALDGVIQGVLDGVEVNGLDV
ncbi:beta strand repeat-containing protein [Prauserella oleivorans]|uniref:Beta strand repeat-containing protein n=1 Tax=Prauserella oleivorans TaxID=1478153 RepID=A0ABW5WFX4_9PSEU